MPLLHPDWPVLTTYRDAFLRRVALPLGGIGTGTVSLGGRGDLRDWELMNRPAKGFTPGGAFFALYAKAGEAPAVARALEGAIDPVDYEGATGCPVPNAGLPRFRACVFHAAYPLAQVTLSDPDVPVTARLDAFTPFIPADADASGFPGAMLRWTLTNTTDETVTASICGTLPRLTGDAEAVCIERTEGLRGVLLMNASDRAGKEEWGTLALATTAEDVTLRTHWLNTGWNVPMLDFWDDFSGDGRLDPRLEGTPHGGVTAAVTLAPGASQTVTFILAWHFPNRFTWTPVETTEECGCAGGCCAGTTSPNFVGNYYCTQFADAWDAATQLAARLPELEGRTLAFVRAFCAADLPAVVKEAALFNLSTLRSQTCFRTPDGLFFGWEGCHDNTGCCWGSCTHVWNYEQATPFLFGSLARSMREVEFNHATLENGLMCFRVSLPLPRATAWPFAAADGQMGCLMKLYRDWQLSGDDELLARLWPKAKAALAFCWVPGGWDADADGVMEGCQHNTMDVEYLGPNGQMGGWYLGALRACEAMARAMGDDAFADRCRDLYARGSAWMDAHLFNGEYYEQELRLPEKAEDIAAGLRIGMGAEEVHTPRFQLGAACLVDQLVGQYMADVCGLGDLLDPAHVRATLESIYRYNFVPLEGHFNNMRTYALREESGVLMASYPRGDRPREPFPYFNEVMTGFEYTAAVGLLYAGEVEKGLEIIAAIRARYDGRKRSPFDEAECGHHYARAMASWAAVLALTGFHYSAVTGEMAFAANPGTHFWSTGDAWGTCVITAEHNATLTVIAGPLRLATLRLGEAAHAVDRTLGAGETVTV